MPRVKLLQGLSQAVMDQKAPAGSYFNSLTQEPYGDVINFIPIINFKNRIYITMGEGLRCRSLDMVHGVGDPGILCQTCKLKDWPEDRRKAGEQLDPKLAGPECRVSMNWVVLVTASSGLDGKPGSREAKELDEPEWAVIQWTSMSSRAAKKLNGLFLQSKTLRPNAQWWDRVYELKVQNVRSEKGNFYLPELRPIGKSTEEQKNACLAVASFMRGKTLEYEVQEEDLQTDEQVGQANVKAQVGEDTEF